MPKNNVPLGLFVSALLCYPAVTEAAQTPAAAPANLIYELAFSVASIRPSPPPDNPKQPGSGNISYSPIRFTAVNMPLRFVILAAYDLQQPRLSGGPDWIYSERTISWRLWIRSRPGRT